MIFKFKKRIYLDYASATPICSEVQKEISKKCKYFANPGSLYSEGRDVKRFIEESRQKVSNILNCRKEEIIFTSGATESNNLAIFGVIDSFFKNHKGGKPHIITTSIEHSSILEAVEKIKAMGVDVTVVNAEENGVIDPKKIKNSLRQNTILVTMMYANNEIGTIQPVRDVSKIIHKYKTQNQNAFSPYYPFFHTDAAQAANYLSLDTVLLGADMMSIDGGKVYGMKGTGCLYKKKFVSLVPQIVGGGQEFGVRSSTENIIGIASFATALEVAQKTKQKESDRLKKLQKYFFKKILEIGGTTINGDLDNRLANNISFCISGMDAEFALFCLDEDGISSSSASTCMNNKEDSYSYVIKSIKPGANCEKSSLRFTMGRYTVKNDIDKCIKSLKRLLKLQYQELLHE